MKKIRIGTAGWSIPRAVADAFPGQGQHLERYALQIRCAEINTSFYRSHARETYERWAAQTPAGFRFSVKLPRTITHEGRLRRAREPLRQFLGEVAGLGRKLGVLLVQLPPSFAYELRPVRKFFELMREEGVTCAVAVEPRHASWFSAATDRVLSAARISRVGADPALNAEAARPGGWLGELSYHRWHGSPRMYWSAYGPDWLARQAFAVKLAGNTSAEVWCIFDNTAGGQALPNAVSLRQMLGDRQ